MSKDSTLRGLARVLGTLMLVTLVLYLMGRLFVLALDSHPFATAFCLACLAYPATQGARKILPRYPREEK